MTKSHSSSTWSQNDLYDGRRFYPIDTAPKAKRFAAFDTEDDSRGRLLFTCFHSGEKSVGFRSREKALEFLYNLGLRRPLFLVAHNLEYDLVNLFRDRLTALEWCFFGGRLIAARATGTRLVFWDSLNHSYHAPLSKLGAVVGVKKLETDHAWTKGKRFTKRDERYCETDTEIVVKYMNAVQEMYLKAGADCRSPTPATTMDLWRRQYLTEAIPALTEKVTTWFRGAYFGGRVEIFRFKAKHRIRYYDVNSLYPTVMQGKYPDLLSLRDGGKHGIVEAVVEVPEMLIPPLPVRLEGRLCFPIGRFMGRWCTCELEYARLLGVRVLSVKSWLGSDVTVSPFRRFVRECYSKRMGSTTDLEKITWKFIMNSLYGKFGTRGTVQRLVDPETADLDGTEFYVGSLVCVNVERDPPPYANVLWAAWTTALARIYLHRMLVGLLKDGHEPLYCDTDSVIFQISPGAPAPPTGSALGEWKLEEKITEFETRAPKVYRYRTEAGETIRAKGVPRSVAEAFFEGREATWQKPLKMREAARSGGSPNVWIQAKKSLQTVYNRRILLKSGKTFPLTMEGG